MAKQKERKALKRGVSSFNLVGRINRLTDKTFSIGTEYESGWKDNSMYIGVDCGDQNIVYTEMRSGFFPQNPNKIRAYSKNEKDTNGKSKSVEIDWEDRLDESLFDEVAKGSLFTIGIEKDVHDKILRKNFLTAYDSIEYLNEHLEEGMVVNVRGEIKYSEYNGSVQKKKEIKSIVLIDTANALKKLKQINGEDAKIEDIFEASFSQTILIDSKSIGKTDEEKNTIELNAYVVDYVGSPKIDGNKVEIKKNVCYPILFEVEVNQDKKEITAKMLQKYFKPSKKSMLNELAVKGKLVEGKSIVNVSLDDIPEDIKELIEMGLYSEEEAEDMMAVGNNNKDKRMVIVKPDIVYVGQGEERKISLHFEPDNYDNDDLLFYEEALLNAGVVIEENENSSKEENAESLTTEEDDFIALLNAM